MSGVELSPIAEYEEVGHIFRPELLSAEEVATINDECDRIVADGQRPGLVLEKDEQTLRSVFNPHLYSDVLGRLGRHPRVLSNKATAPTIRSRDIVPDDSTVRALQALGDDCLLVGAAAV